MKTLHLSTDTAFNERDQILAILKNATPEGYTFEEVRGCLRLIDKIECSPNGGLTLEDEEWKVLKSRIAKVRWTVAARDIVTLVEKINEAKDHPLEGASS